jgi:hypothetical protein
VIQRRRNSRPTSSLLRPGFGWAALPGSALLRVALAGAALPGSVLLASALLPAGAAAQTPPRNSPPPVQVELEAGPVWQSYNDVEIPNDGTSTRFSLFDLAGAGPWAGGRLYLTWNAGERHGLRVLVAPFSLTETGVPDGEVRFQGATFQAGVPTRARYTFNSYRLSYRYRLRDGASTTAWVGFTAKIRDAVIALEQESPSGPVQGRKDDLGFVPLLHLAGEWRVAPGWRVALDADALAGGPGRAVDAALTLGYDVNDRWRVRTGYRTVEGGAEVTEVYTFAWLHAAVLGVEWRR